MMLLAKSLTIIFLAKNSHKMVLHAKSLVMKQACGLITPESLEAKTTVIRCYHGQEQWSLAKGFLQREWCTASYEDILAKGMMLLAKSLTMLLLAEIPPIALRRVRERRILKRDEKHCFPQRCDIPLPWEVAATTCLEAFFLVFLYLFE